MSPWVSRIRYIFVPVTWHSRVVPRLNTDPYYALVRGLNAPTREGEERGSRTAGGHSRRLEPIPEHCRRARHALAISAHNRRAQGTPVAALRRICTVATSAITPGRSTRGRDMSTSMLALVREKENSQEPAAWASGTGTRKMTLPRYSGRARLAWQKRRNSATSARAQEPSAVA